MNNFLAIASAAFIGATLVACGTPATEIADLSVVTTLPKDVGPGGFDKTLSADGIATGVFYKASLNECSPRIDEVGRAWAGQHALTETRSDHTGSTTLHFTSDRFPSGEFVITYTLAPDRLTARLHMTYQEPSGGQRRSAKDFESLGLEPLIDSLLTAVKCDSNTHQLSGPPT